MKARHKKHQWIVDRLDELGLSQTWLAAECSVRYQTLWKWLIGKHTPDFHHRLSLAKALEMDPAEVHARLLDEDMNRREALTGAVAVTSTLLLAGFSAALEEPPFTRERWVAELDALGTAYMTAGPASVREQAAALLHRIKGEPPEAWRWAIAARLMSTYAKSFGGDEEQAIEWHRLARTAADRSGDADSRIWVRGRAASALGCEHGDPTLAIRLCREAAEISGNAPSQGLLIAQLGASQAAAFIGDVATARQFDEDSRRVFDAIGADEALTDYVVPYWRYQTRRSLALVRQGLAKEALEAQAEARKSTPKHLVRANAHLDMHLALLLAKTGDRSGGNSLAQSTFSNLPIAHRSAFMKAIVAEVQDA